LSNFEYIYIFIVIILLSNLCVLNRHMIAWTMKTE